MHALEPFYSWQLLYVASEDENSPFFDRDYSEFEFKYSIYNHYIHPQWDEFGSTTLYLKILFVDYDMGYTIIEFLGEWNDCLYNDIMFLKRNIVEYMQNFGINKFILIGENVLNFHSSDDSYYQEWFDDIEDGWIIGMNFRQHVIAEFESANIDYYICFGESTDIDNWRSYSPSHLYEKVFKIMRKRLAI